MSAPSKAARIPTSSVCTTTCKSRLTLCVSPNQHRYANLRNPIRETLSGSQPISRKRLMPKRVLILCTGNSCRSQMAEVIWNTHANGQWEAISAGSRPSGYVHPLAIKALEQIDLPTDGLQSKSSQPFESQPFDLVVTVCGNAQADCPVWPGASEVVHWPFEDPADATGTDQEKFACFVDIRDQIKTRIVAYLNDTTT